MIHPFLRRQTACRALARADLDPDLPEAGVVFADFLICTENKLIFSMDMNKFDQSLEWPLEGGERMEK